MGDLGPKALLFFSAVGAAALVVLFLFLRNFRWGLPLLGATLFFSSLGVHVSKWDNQRNYTWMAPLQERRSEIVAALTSLLLLGVFVHLRRLSTRKLSPRGLAYLVMMLYAGLLRMGQESVLDGLASLLLALLSFVPLLVVVPNLLRDWKDYESMLWAVLWTMLVWCGATFLQVFIDREQLFSAAGTHWGYRFTGLTPNPQTAGLLLSLTGGIGLWLIVNGRKGWGLSRLLAIGITGSILVMLLWTGSRTGAAMFLIMACSVFYARIGRAAILVPILALVTYGLWSYATTTLDVDTGLTRLVSTENTRSVVWAEMWRTGVDNFMFGVGADESPASENSYLYGFASYGIGMVFLMLIMVAVSAAQVIRLVRVRRFLAPQQQRLVELIIGFNATYFCGSFFEAYMLGRINLVTVLLFMFGGMSTKLFEHVGLDEPNSLEWSYADYEGEYGEAGHP